MYNKYKILLIIIIVLQVSCNFEKKHEELEFVNNDFKYVIDNFITNSKKKSRIEIKEILIQLETFNNDTLLNIENIYPYELDNLKLKKNYNGYVFYFYVPNHLNEKLHDLIKFDDSVNANFKNYTFNKSDIDVFYCNSYLFKNKKIYEIELPLIWSTDSTYNLKSFDRFIKVKN